MNAPNASFGRALLLSLLLHAALFLAGARWNMDEPRRSVPPPPPLEATLVPPETGAPAQPPLVLPEPAPAEQERSAARRLAARHLDSERSPGRKVPGSRPAPQDAPASAAAAPGAASAQVARNLLYPPDAIARGLEGEALVLLFLDESGNALAARLERSSGHPILDEAAIRAATTVRSLPHGSPREVLLPVRFRLR